MRFEWDDNKAESNFLKHGIQFEEAVTVFADPYLMFTDDSSHSQGEEREWVSQTIDKNGQPCLLDPRSPTTFSDEGCPFLSRFSPRAIGEVEDGSIVVVVFTMRGERIRLISARKATIRECQQYESGI